ncbi:MAG: RNA 2'-phosphotransferase [Phormidesmis sp.]
MAHNTVKFSKLLSYVLRHRPEKIGIALDSQGWVTVETLLQQTNVHGYPLTRPLLEEIVKTNSNQ